MDEEVLQGLRRLLSERRVLCLAAVIDGEPAASLLPFAAAPDFRAVFVQASELAKHSRALQTGAGVGLLFHEPDTDDVDPLQVPRLSVQATVAVLERGTGEFDAARRLFEERLPSAAMTLDLADFNLYRLEFGRGRYVAGFAQAYNVGPDTFQALGQSTKS
jgi:putative heme iron utilization protein